MKKILLATVAAMAMAGSAQATVVNVNATTPTGTSLTLAAGTYSVNVIGVADGGAYDAYDIFAAAFNPVVPAVAGCDAMGANCSAGFQNSYLTSINGVETGHSLTGTGQFSTALGALAAAKAGLSSTFTLATAATVLFNHTDRGQLFDNSGGVSLNVAAVPEPATWAMMLIGFGMIGAASRYRRKSTNVAYA